MAQSDIRLLRADDIDAVLAIQSRAYTQLIPESADVLLSKLRVSPQTCWLAQVDGQAAGYLLTHPWSAHMPPALHARIDALPAGADCLYLHDLAIDPVFRGCKIAQALVSGALQKAQALGFAQSALIAVQASRRFWARFGFAPVADPQPALREKLAGYGADATFMLRCSGPTF